MASPLAAKPYDASDHWKVTTKAASPGIRRMNTPAKARAQSRGLAEKFQMIKQELKKPGLEKGEGRYIA